MSWPTVKFDSVTRLRILAAARPHLGYAETLIARPFERVWSIVGDMENGTPQFETGIEHVRILERSGTRLRLQAAGRFGPAMTLHAELEPGWCLMWSGRLEIGIAASSTQDGTQTRLAHFEGVRGSGRLLAPLFWWKIRRELREMSRLSLVGDSGLGAE
jgi:hypothetical protein